MAENVKPGGLSLVTDAEAFGSMDKDFDLVIFGPGEEKMTTTIKRICIC